MKYKFMAFSLGAVIVALMSGVAGAAGGEVLYSDKGCAACHGADGNSPISSGYPKLAGQNKEYLVQQIQDIKSGARDNGLTAQMRPVAQGLTDAEIESIADYLSSF